MKKIIPSIFTLIAFFSAKAQIVNIPDPVFKNFLVNHSYSTNPTGIGTTIYLDANHDGQIQYTEAASYTSNIFNHGFYLNSGLNISDLTGIEAFQSIEYLNIDNNQLTALNISGCSSLKTLICGNNLFTSLSLNSASLETLDCNNVAPLISLDLGGCPALKKATIQANANLSSIDLDGCGYLEELRINQNSQLSVLQMGNHSQLRLFQCYNNQLTSLDVSNCGALQYLFCTGNQFSSLNLANGNPQSFIQIIADGYPDLTCIKVDNVAVSEFLWDGGYPYTFDQWATFNTDCTPAGPCVVAIPDPKFKAKLTANSAINTNGNAEIECAEAEAYTGTINVDNSDISDMTGIEAFIHITALSCNDNNDWAFSSLDVSGFTALTSLSCTGNNDFETLSVNGCTALVNFTVDRGMNGSELHVNAANCTALTGFNASGWGGLFLDLNGCSALTSLNLDGKQLKSLDVRNCSALANLVCSNNALTALPVSGCTSLTDLNCSNNSLVSLTVSDLPLVNLDCSRNELTSLNVLDNNNLSVLNCSNNQLPYLMVSNNPALTQLNCSNNNISYLDVNNNANLTHLDCSYNNLGAQNVSTNTALLSFNCSHNNITSQNISSNTALTTFYCDYNQLSNINVSNNPNLRILGCAHNQLTNLDLSHTSLLSILECSNNLLTQLDLSVVPNVFQLSCKQNQLAGLDLSDTQCRLLNCEGNQLESLNFANGYNSGTIMFFAQDNPALECIQVDNAAHSTASWTNPDFFMFDAGIIFSEDCASLGIDPVNTNGAFAVYPNPTKDLVYFSRPTHVRLYNITGQLIAEKENVNSLDLSNQPQGVYLIAHIAANGQVAQHNKIVKE